ncbi:ig family protein [Stylonychia lemnae]|uniref:Ig family protein n=1 Tax=Stylonychia lemnae TaxID=5949 RepID=A0A077ZPP2_STYLE|nr:ig family protein [Stylonychia lemnae]|eukprot:CDW71340.1 ig family protein [Stylonychia lemnae]
MNINIHKKIRVKLKILSLKIQRSNNQKAQMVSNILFWIRKILDIEVSLGTLKSRISKRQVEKPKLKRIIQIKTKKENLTEILIAQMESSIQIGSEKMMEVTLRPEPWIQKMLLCENGQIWQSGCCTATSGNSNRVSALIALLDDDLSISPLIRIWSNSGATGTPDQEATDVDTTSDGGIFVTGFIQNAFSLGGYDCFILRLNYTLDVIYAKSFGTSTDHEQCYSIQVTRNYDYIYLGGIKYLTVGPTKREMIFYKFDSYGDSGIAKSLMPTGTENLSLKRIMLTERKTFSGTNDNNELYFCGYTDTNNGDILVGTVTSNSLSSISISVAFRYGSPQYETIGDCAMTEDNAYIILLFNTNHHMDRKSYSTTTSTKPIDYNLVYNAINPADYNSPYVITGGCYSACSRRATNTLIASHHTSIINYCEDNLFNQIDDYMTDYRNGDIYSWTTCDFYVFDYNAVDCSIENVRFSECSDWSGTLGSSDDYISNGVNAANNDCKWALSSINTEKPWYSTNCRNDQFKKNVYERLFTTYTTTTQRYSFWPYMFCIDNDGTQTNNYCTYDDINLIFEQDCTDDTNRGSYYNWFIIKIQVSTFVAGSMSAFPLEAAYFGDRDGNTVGYSIAVDDLGFIYITGTTDSNRLGAVSSEIVWLYAKTHWRMTFEARYKQTNALYKGVSEYLGKRFIRPKKYTNNDNPFYPSTSTTFSFTHNYLTESSVISYQTSDASISSHQINEKIFTLSFSQPVTLITLHIYTTGFLTDKAMTKSQMADSHASMSQTDPIRFVKTSTFTQYANLPNICLHYTDAGFDPTSLYKMDFYQKGYETSGTVSSITITSTSDVSSQSYLSLATSINEGIHYLWIQGNSLSYQYTTTYDCPNTHYGYYADNYLFRSQRRYETSLIVKVIVDDETLFPPENKQNIPDIAPVLGQKYSISNIDSYFTTSCSYFKVKRNKLLTASTSTNFNSTMIPYWMMFYEQNKTFVMYPESLGDIYIDVFCYNDIEEYAINTFLVSPKDTTPVSTFGTGITPYTIQYDKYGAVGQYFQWSMTTTYFTDADTSSDALDTTYKHTDHTVWLTYTTPYISGFKQIKWMGMMFGQSFQTTLNNIGTKTFNYQYQDQYSQNSIPTATFSIKINQIPSPQTIGINYKFSNIDPTDGLPTTYFDDIFPWVKDDYSNIINIFSATWFTDPDLDTLTYSLTMSDSTDRPLWIGFDKGTGELRGYPMVSDASRLMNLKFTAFDTKDGSYSFYKTLLVNVKPKNRVIYKEVRIGIDRYYAYNVSNLFYDQDGDPLSFSIPDSNELSSIREIGLDFYPANKLLAGKPSQLGTTSLIKIQASDPHGETSHIYFTIVVKDYRPYQRRNVQQYKDQVVTQGQYFYFTQPNLVFYDPGDDEPLVVYASTLDDEPLPTWLHFDPVSRGFYGVAPTVMTLKVQLRAMNQVSHDSKAFAFNLKVVPNYNPKTVVRHFSDDLTIYINDWFNISLDIQLFRDVEINRNATMSMRGSYGIDLPQWIKFNEDNRTIFGQATDYGVFRIDIQYVDDLGLKTYFNVKLTVLNQVRVDPSKIKINYVLFSITAIGFIIYMVYLVHFNFQVYVAHKKQDVKERGIKNARKRFENYQEIEVFYHMPLTKSYVDQSRQKYIRTVDSQETEKDDDEDIRGLQKRLKIIR